MAAPSMHQHYQALVLTADAVSAVAVIGAIVGWAPPLAAMGALVWYIVQIYESKTVQQWLGRRRQRRESRARVEAHLLRQRKGERDRSRRLHGHVE